MKNIINRAFMAKKKKLYSAPRVEAMFMEPLGTIMKTSLDLLPDMAPRRYWTEVF